MGTSVPPKIAILKDRARIVQQIRAFFIELDFFEVETPHLIPVNAPEPYIDAVVAGNGYLQTSPELAMKSLLAAGCDNIFQICRCWRDAERGKRHLPEFSMLEWYRADADYHQMMDDCEGLLRSLLPQGRIDWQGTVIDIEQPWPRLSLEEAFRCYADISLSEAMVTNRFEEVLTDSVEPNLGIEQPTFLLDYPASMAALARHKVDAPHLAERFELYIGGMEIANAFSELVDPDEQRCRFEDDRRQRQRLGKDPYPMPERFLANLAQMPDAAGIALGVDRLIMLLCDKPEIDDVVAFTWESLND